MGLKKCKDCGHEVSTSAKACPNCGRKSPTSMAFGERLVVAVVLILVVFLISSIATFCSSFTSPQEPPSNEPAAAPTQPSTPPTDLSPVTEAPAEAEQEPVADEPTFSFERFRGPGIYTFIYVENGREAPRHYLMDIARSVRLNNYACQIMFWDNRNRVPDNLPMSDREVNSMFAHYSYNRGTGLDELVLMRNGQIIEE